MTSPSGHTPDRMLNGLSGIEAWSKKTRAEYEEEVMGRVSGSTGKLGDFFRRFFGLERQLTDTFVDGQLTLNGRVDLLAGVNGYAAAYMGRNWNILPGTANRMPYGEQIGPVKNARVVKNGLQVGYIELLADGLWRADALANISSGGDNYELYLAVRDPSGNLYSEKKIDGAAGKGSRVSLQATHTFVVDSPGYTVHVILAWGGIGWKNVRGGTRMSALTVNRWSADHGAGSGSQDVPDGGDL